MKINHVIRVTSDKDYIGVRCAECGVDNMLRSGPQLRHHLEFENRGYFPLSKQLGKEHLSFCEKCWAEFSRMMEVDMR